MSPIVSVAPAAKTPAALLDVITEAVKDPTVTDSHWPALANTADLIAWMDSIGGDFWLIRVDGEPCGVLHVHAPHDGVSYSASTMYLVPDAREGNVGALASTQAVSLYPPGTLLHIHTP